MKKKNGFTLVELLAVIVVLAIIMIIAIPSVLDVMNNARRSTFREYVIKVVTAVQTQYTYDANGGNIGGSGYYVYDITSDLSLTSTGDYKGYVVVDAYDVDDVKYYINMYDKNYMIVAYNVTKNGMPEADDQNAIQPYSSTEYNDKLASPVRACHASLGSNEVTCQDRRGYEITEQ